MFRRSLLAAAAAVSVVMTSCAAPGGPASAGAASSTSSWAAFSTRFMEGYFQQNPTFAISQGRHEFDGRLPDWSPQGLAARAAFLNGALAEAEQFNPRRLTAEERFERDYLIARVRGDLFWLEGADQPHRNPSYYMDSLSPAVYIARPYATPEARMRAFIAYLNNVPAATAQIRANLRTPLPISFVDYAKANFGGFAAYYPTDGKAAFAEVKNPALQRELDDAARKASAAMKGLAEWAEAQRPGAGTNFALGAETFARMLRDTEMVDTPLSELEAIGRADLASNQSQLREACAEYAPGATVQACIDKMSAKKPQGGAVAGARAQLAGIKAFIAANDLVSIPGTEEAQVAEAPPYNRQNFAYIDIPGTYEKGLPSVYYIAPPDPSWSKEVQAGFVPGEADLLFTSVHEVWPGHFLNFLHSNRSRFTFGKVFVGYAYAEGWAHYTEEMMRQAGLGGATPEIRIGQLSNALLRDCRFLSAIGMHTGRMTQEQSRQMFLTECFQDEGNARQQAARGTYDPAYLNYTLGKLMIRRLREDWTATRGGRAGWKAFHDQFLSYGGPPIPLVRAQMMGGDPKAAF